MLKLTLAEGQVVEVPFDASAVLTVESEVQVEPTIRRRVARSWTAVTAVELEVEQPPAKKPKKA